MASSPQGGPGNGTDITGPKQTLEQSLLAKRRAGGARSRGRRKNQGMHLAALTQSPGGQSRRTRQWHRHNWPETDVGAGLLAKRRAGGARSQGRHKTQAMHLAALMRFHDRLLGAPLEISSWPPSASRCCCSALQTVRRPRGASRASSAPTFVSGQLCLCHCLVRLDCPPGDWVRAAPRGRRTVARAPEASSHAPGGPDPIPSQTNKAVQVIPQT